MTADRPSRVAYLVNQYPQASHTFIRREVAAVEALGVAVDRFTLRAADGPAVDPADAAEARKTRAVLGAGPLGLLAATLGAMASRPRRFLRAAGAALAAGGRSDRGRLVHLVYLAEACVLRGWLARSGASHLHAHFGTNSAAVAMLCRLLGGPPYSFTAHGPEEFDDPRGLSLGAKVHHAAFAAAVSDFGLSQLCRWADPADWGKLRVVRCGVDSAYLDAGPTPVPAAPRLVCVGRLAEQKGQLVLVEAAALLRDRGAAFEVALVGDGPMRPALERRIAALGLGGVVKLAGWGDGEAVRREVLRSRALVLPSFAEGLPVVIMEALALGRPVIATYVAGIPELVAPGVCGWLVPAGSAVALADAMAEALAADVAELGRMGREGALRVAARHDARAGAASLASAFAGGRPGRGREPRPGDAPSPRRAARPLAIGPSSR